jgi:hypothetical protein
MAAAKTEAPSTSVATPSKVTTDASVSASATKQRKTLKFAVGSENAAKLNSVKQVVVKVFVDCDISIVGVSVDSGVAAQPKSAEETQKGALTRAKSALSSVSDAHYGIGLEGGV